MKVLNIVILGSQKEELKEALSKMAFSVGTTQVELNVSTNSASTKNADIVFGTFSSSNLSSAQKLIDTLDKVEIAGGTTVSILNLKQPAPSVLAFHRKPHSPEREQMIEQVVLSSLNIRGFTSCTLERCDLSLVGLVGKVVNKAIGNCLEKDKIIEGFENINGLG